MQALNFLYEIPTENWLDYAVRPKSLLERLHKCDERKEPSVESLFCEFVDHAVMEQGLIRKEFQELAGDFDDEENLSHKMKAATLWNLSFCAAGHMKWNMKQIVDALGLVRSSEFMRGLMDAHFTAGGGQSWQTNLELVDLTDLFTATPSAQFAFIMYCRWHVYCAVNESLPRLPAKQTVSNPSSMQDPVLIAAEKRSVFLADLCQKSGCVASILEKLCVLFLPQFSIMTMNCFELPEDGKLEYCCDWSAMEVTGGGNLVSQLRYDLGSYYFFTKQYGKAKECFSHFSNVKNFEDFQSSGHFNLTPAAVKGFCAAFKLPTDFTASPTKMDSLARLENGEMTEFSKVISSPSTRRLKFSIRQRLGSVRLPDLLWIRSEAQFLIHRIIDGFGLRHGQLNALEAEEFQVAFLQEVVAWWDSMSLAERLCMRTTLSYLCVRVPQFESHFQREFSGIFSASEISSIQRLASAPPAVKPPSLNAGKSLNRLLMAAVEQNEDPDSATPALLIDCYRSELSSNHGKRWSLLVSYDPEEIRSLIPHVSSPWVSTLWQTLAHLDPIISQLGHPALMDIEFAVCCKAQQLGFVGALKDSSSLLNFCEDELMRFAAQPGSKFNQSIETMRFGLRIEGLRYALLWWHNSMALPPVADAGENPSKRPPFLKNLGMNSIEFTDHLKARVKSMFAELDASSKQKNLNPAAPLQEVVNAEVITVACAFLVNNCEYNYLMMNCKSVKPVVDFSLLLSALCVEVKNSSDIKDRLAREFFELLLSTMIESTSHGKRKADGQLSKTLNISRAELGGIIKHLKEPLCVALLLSFLCKMFNCLDTALTTKRTVWSNYAYLWPPTYTEATGVNAEFVKDMISQLLENARLTNPEHPGWLRSEADFSFANLQFGKAMRGYLQLMFVLSEGFSKPLDSVLESPEVGDQVVRNMIQCASRMKCHTQEALLWQLIAKPDYVAALKAMEERLIYDAGTDYFQFIWDINLIEFVIYACEKRNDQLKIQEAVKVLDQPEMNSHNRADVLSIVRERKRRRFLQTLMSHYG